MEINKVYHMDCLEGMKGIADKSIDLTVTSPPYDNLRTYNNSLEWSFEIFQSIAKELYRVTKDGGVVVWVVGDATIKGSETGTSFKQALYFKECGFNLHDTMIYKFAGTGAKGSNLAYWQGFEYMFIFSKGKIKTFNPIRDHKNVKAGHITGHTGEFANGTRKTRGIRVVPEYSKRDNIWVYGGSVGDKTEHTAQFPEQLAHDHILSWSNEGDTILEPFAGSGTAIKQAILLNRNYIGFEKEEKYYHIIQERIKKHTQQLKLIA